MRLAIIGGGISGVGAALALSETHDVVLFERDARLGGHANTRDIEYPLPSGGHTPISVDTGFIVYNQKTYPNLTSFFEHLSVPTEWSDMSLSFCVDGGKTEWAACNLDKIFAQRSNLLRLRFIRSVREILRFNKAAQRTLTEGPSEDEPLGAWLDRHGFSERFRQLYLYPMAGAIWSTRSTHIAEFPARALFGFYENHDLLIGIGDAVQWRTVTGGSREYVCRAAQALGPRVRLGASVQRVTPVSGGVDIQIAGAGAEHFDGVILATHSDQALALHAAPDSETRELLSRIKYTANRAVLHRDPSLMPKRQKVWSSWNTRVGAGAEKSGASLNYWMNRLQNIDRATPLFVTLNPDKEPDPALTFAEDSYAHPYFDGGAMSAQAEFDRVQGRGGVWYAGAWLGYGFHEDGLRSGLRAAAMLGAQPAWARDLGAPLPLARIAAE